MSYCCKVLVLAGMIFTSCQGRQIPGNESKSIQNGNGSHPNILFILVDDLGWKDLGYMGSEGYETPKIDQLASEGMTFTNFYSGGPVCSPTRASIMAGKSPARTGITYALASPDTDEIYINHQLELSEFTVAEAFLGNGYETGFFGKWHLGHDLKDWAENQGFKTAIGGTTSKNAWKTAYPDKEPPIDQYEVRYFSPHYFIHMDSGPDGEYLTDRLTDETINFIEEQKNNPFFAYLSFHTVHTPLQAKPEVVEKYRKKFEKEGILGNSERESGSLKYQNIPEYAAMVQHLDDNVGRLLEKVKEFGLEDNTIVVFTSDNGGKDEVTSNEPLRGAKHNLYEGGIRVPLIVRWPGSIKAGSESKEPLISHDFYPTLLDLCGFPTYPKQHVDGVSFKDVLQNRNDKVNREALYWHFPHGVFQGAMRWGDYKLLHHYKTGETELYNLLLDTGEKNDLSEAKPEVTKKMKMMLRQWLVQSGAKFPEEGIQLP